MNIEVIIEWLATNFYKWKEKNIVFVINYCFINKVKRNKLDILY